MRNCNSSRRRRAKVALTSSPPSRSQSLCAASTNCAAARRGRRAVTISTSTEAAQWFAYHEDESGHDAQDQEMLEMCWARLHAALPELGDQIEVIETATPRTYYEQTRRKLGLIGSIGRAPAAFGAHAFTHRTPFQNLYMVGDTVFPGASLAAVTHSALIVADEIKK